MSAPIWSGDLPGPEEYVALRAMTGLGPRTVEAARRALPNTLFSVTVRDGGTLVGMGRVVGDRGSFVQIVDVAVHPDRQGTGIGTGIMSRLMAWCEAELPECCHVSLVSSPGAAPLYERFGFQPTRGMDRYAGPTFSDR